MLGASPAHLENGLGVHYKPKQTEVRNHYSECFISIIIKPGCLPLLFTGCVNISKLFNLSVLQRPNLKNEIPPLTDLLHGFKK